MPAIPYELTPALGALVAFSLALVALYWLSRQVSFQIQTLVYYITGSEDMVTVALFLVYLPGVFIHESAHWIMARLLGLKTGKFRVWPKRQGRSIGMGSVSVQQGGVWRDSLVGMAPLIAGSILITYIAHQIFTASLLTNAWAQGRWWDGLSVFWLALGKPDGALWAYLLFAIANSMMPSPSDRQPLNSLVLYVAGAAALYLLLGLPLNPLTSALDWSAPFLQQLTSALIFVIILDVLIIGVLWVLSLVFRPSR